MGVYRPEHDMLLVNLIEVLMWGALALAGAILSLVWCIITGLIKCFDD